MKKYRVEYQTYSKRIVNKSIQDGYDMEWSTIREEQGLIYRYKYFDDANKAKEFAKTRNSKVEKLVKETIMIYSTKF